MIIDCDELHKFYRDTLLKVESISGFLEHLRLKEQIVGEHSSVESFVLSYFA